MPFTTDSLHFDVGQEIQAIAEGIRTAVRGTLRRRGAVIAVSGGIDSAACAALCVQALGPEHVLLVCLPEESSSPDSLRLGQLLAEVLGARVEVDDVTELLRATGCYLRQTEAIREVFPDYGDGWKHKLTLPSILEGDRLNVSRLTVEAPSGQQHSARMAAPAYLKLVAATNFKQRARTTMAYYHADRLNYAVAGTPNRLEYDQGFFVKHGDGAADLKPIAHLYKTQVYALAAHVGVPAEIRRRPPTTDTFSMPQSQEEFYFSLPYDKMDVCLYGRNQGVAAADVGAVIGLTAEQVERVYKDIDQKRRTTAYLHMKPLLAEPVPEVAG